MNSSSNTSKNMMNSPFKKYIFYIASFIFLLIILYIIYYAWQKTQLTNANEPIINADIIDADVARNGVAVPTPTEGLTQSVSTWIYIRDYQYAYGKYKNILWKGTKGGSGVAPRHSPSIWLYPLTNNLKVLTSVEDTTTPVESCDIQNIPLMKWVHIVYVLNNRTVDVYINGKLERSCALKAVPKLQEDSIFLTGGDPAGYYGKLGKTQYFTKALMSHEIADLYNSGPIGASQYNVKFFQDGKIISMKSTSSVDMEKSGSS